MSFGDRIAACNTWAPDRYRPLRVDGLDVGLVTAEFAGLLAEFPDVFSFREHEVGLVAGVEGFERRTAAVDGVLRELARRGAITRWRDEPYPVAPAFTAPALFNVERAAVPLLGVIGYGVHLNGYVRDGDRLAMWIGRRSLTKHTAPGKLDQLVAGGQPAGLSLADNLVKECAEEASLPPEMVAHAVSVGAVSYCTEQPEGLRRDVLFNYDLELPPDFTPVNTDGEIAEFFLWPIEQVAETVRDTDAFKFNCALVVIDFLIRHGILPPDHPEYLELVEGLHR